MVNTRSHYIYAHSKDLSTQSEEELLQWMRVIASKCPKCKSHLPPMVQKVSLPGPPLPHGWEAALDSNGKVYFIDHNKKTTTLTDPRYPPPVQYAYPPQAMFAPPPMHAYPAPMPMGYGMTGYTVPAPQPVYTPPAPATFSPPTTAPFGTMYPYHVIRSSSYRNSTPLSNSSSSSYSSSSEYRRNSTSSNYPTINLHASAPSAPPLDPQPLQSQVQKPDVSEKNMMTEHFQQMTLIFGQKSTSSVENVRFIRVII